MSETPRVERRSAQVCIDRGCERRFECIEIRQDRVDNPENGAIKQLHEKVNKMVRFSTFTKSIAAGWIVFAFIVGGIVGYVVTENARQDRLIEMVNGKLDTITQLLMKHDRGGK